MSGSVTAMPRTGRHTGRSVTTIVLKQGRASRSYRASMPLARPEPFRREDWCAAPRCACVDGTRAGTPSAGAATSLWHGSAHQLLMRARHACVTITALSVSSSPDWLAAALPHATAAGGTSRLADAAATVRPVDKLAAGRRPSACTGTAGRRPPTEPARGASSSPRRGSATAAAPIPFGAEAWPAPAPVTGPPRLRPRRPPRTQRRRPRCSRRPLHSQAPPEAL
eukprot:scaffold4749_cov137-Isochrysis_galbana.AAC.6